MKNKIVIAAGIAAFVAAAAIIIAGKYVAFSDEVKAGLAFGAAGRALLACATGCLIYVYGFSRRILPRGGWLPFAAGSAVTLANFPFICLIRGTLTVTTDGGGIVLFILYCISVGVFEELLFRGLVFQLLAGLMQKVKYGEVYSLLAASAVFALTHLFNLFDGAGVGDTFLQVGYSFLVGCMCNVVLIASRGILLPIILHTLFDIGGTLTSTGVAVGMQWDTASIIIMAVVSVAAGLIITAYYFKKCFKKES